VLLLLVLAGSPAVAAAAQAGPGPAPNEVVELGGPIDGRLVSFAEGVVSDTDAQLVVLQLDSPGALDDRATDLIALVADPPVPVAVWVGPAPARATGAAAQVLAAARIRGAAPGVVVGYASPTVAGGGDDAVAVAERVPGMSADAIDGLVEVGEQPVAGLVDLVSPSIGQFIVALDGVEVPVSGGTRTLSTAVTETEDGVEVIKPAAEVRFLKPGIVDRTLRLAVRPEAAFFFLVAGLAFAVFEFYAVGPGIAAGVALVSLLIAGYGLAVLPTNWLAAAASVLGIAVYTADVQRNDLGWRSVLGTGFLVYGGLRLVEADPQIGVSWWPVVLVVVGAALFFGFAMTTVVRARFSTATIGREHLVGRQGTAETALDPDGVVLLGEARWRARAARAAGIGPGDAVRVVGVDGIVLDVEADAESSA
jgi:membrane-bound serine protease (ClpP class)